MSEQVQRPKYGNQNNFDDAEVAFSKPQTTDIDSVLNEIDAVLEKNAEEFVKGFIQKGGQ
jgi:ubiquitin-like protein Pup